MKKELFIGLTFIGIAWLTGCSGQGLDAGNKDAAAPTAEMTEEAMPDPTNKAIAKPSKETSGNVTPAADYSKENDAATKTTQISLNEAKKIALKEAGLSEKEGKWKKQELDRDDGRMIYELEFVSGEREYEFEIDAQTGAVVELKEESVYD